MKLEQDTFGLFLEDRCVRGPNAREFSQNLYDEYKKWAAQNGERDISHKMFASFMSERGFAKQRVGKGILYPGIGLRGPVYQDTTSSAAARPAIAHEQEGEEVQ